MTQVTKNFEIVSIIVGILTIWTVSEIGVVPEHFGQFPIALMLIITTGALSIFTISSYLWKW